MAPTIIGKTFLGQFINLFLIDGMMSFTSLFYQLEIDPILVATLVQRHTLQSVLQLPQCEA